MAEIENTQVNPELEEQKHFCKRCGFDQREEFNPASPEELENYFKSALSQTPFSKTYDLYGGLLQLTFEEATGKLLRLQEQAIIELARENKTSMSDAADYSMLSSLVEIRQVPREGASRVLYSADAARRRELLEKKEIPDELLNMPMIQLQSLRNTYVLFTKHCAALMAAAQDENFWKGVGRN